MHSKSLENRRQQKKEDSKNGIRSLCKRSRLSSPKRKKKLSYRRDTARFRLCWLQIHRSHSSSNQKNATEYHSN